MNHKVVVDIDGVLADFEGAFCEKFGYDHRGRVDLESRYPEKARSIGQFLCDGFVYKSLQPIPLGLEIVDYLYNNEFEIYIVSSRPKFLESVTRDWLNRHGVRFWSLRLESPKTRVIASIKPVCAVDDLFSVRTALLVYNIPTLLIAHPWNYGFDGEYPRITDISEFISEFDRIVQKS